MYTVHTHTTHNSIKPVNHIIFSNYIHFSMISYIVFLHNFLYKHNLHKRELREKGTYIFFWPDFYFFCKIHRWICELDAHTYQDNMHINNIFYESLFILNIYIKVNNVYKKRYIGKHIAHIYICRLHMKVHASLLNLVKCNAKVYDMHAICI